MVANVVPLVRVPLNAFMKAFNNNSKVLESLRRKAKLSDGYFLFKDFSNVSDSMPMVGSMTGNWRLGRVSLVQNDPVYDYQISIYRRSLDRTNTFGSAFVGFAMDDRNLADMLRDLNKGRNIASYPSLYEIEQTEMFANLGFDVC